MEQQQKIAKFNIGDMVPIAMTFVVVGVVLVYGLNVVNDQKVEMNNCASYNNATDHFTYNTSNGLCSNTTGDVTFGPPNATEFIAANNTVTGLAKIPAKLPLIATIAVAAIIIGLIFRFFMNKR